jgi:hypothetical protein
MEQLCFSSSEKAPRRIGHYLAEDVIERLDPFQRPLVSASGRTRTSGAGPQRIRIRTDADAATADAVARGVVACGSVKVKRGAPAAPLPADRAPVARQAGRERGGAILVDQMDGAARDVTEQGREIRWWVRPALPAFRGDRRVR